METEKVYFQYQTGHDLDQEARFFVTAYCMSLWPWCKPVGWSASQQAMAKRLLEFVHRWEQYKAAPEEPGAPQRSILRNGGPS